MLWYIRKNWKLKWSGKYQEIIDLIEALPTEQKDGDAFVTFKDENKEVVEYIFLEKPIALELGTKVMEMFEYKERYDGIIE